MPRTIATWNVNSLRVRLPQLLEWLAATPLDVVALQETKLPDDEFPHAEFAAVGWHSLASGQRTYNGVALLARSAPTDAVTDNPAFADPQRRILAATVAGLRFVNLYVPNGQSVGSDKYEYKLQWLAALCEFLRGELARHPQLIVLGDFNVAPEDRDVHDPAAWAGQVLCSEPERAALRAIFALGLHDVFRRFEQPPQSFSWWDYRAAAFQRNHGLRIDLILASAPVAARCVMSRIDVAPRRAPRPSDHAPVLAAFDI
ncbi:MAG: exodeoxyribonuclease III [Steroidobacteraceae bacterium]|nr:exodeoxyribonuclease III [Steroidobacteraceae bacterium]MDW8258110.1 exodeoxyribonuclease III [Gammaproteobacteria bacterium]